MRSKLPRDYVKSHVLDHVLIICTRSSSCHRKLSRRLNGAELLFFTSKQAIKIIALRAFASFYITIIRNRRTFAKDDQREKYSKKRERKKKKKQIVRDIFADYKFYRNSSVNYIFIRNNNSPRG